MSEASIYLSAGFATSPNFMEEFGKRLRSTVEDLGIHVVVKSVFPYGDWSRSRWAQLAEIRRDLMPSRFRRQRSIGGARLAETVLAHASSDESIVLIGHSAGGLASVHAAGQILAADDSKRLSVVQIGSPRCPIPSALTDSSLYVYAVDRRGKRVDPITRIGRWGGQAPGLVTGLTLIGGHRDYFRSTPPFIDERKQSNLDRINRCVGSWLADRMHLLEPIS
jgi:pimeloyl-ACP methyl ester carboxylesterase